MPEIPILCDPSHICGTQQYIASISETSLEVGLDGLMIESHWRPEAALSDPGQQLSPAQFAELVGQVVRNPNLGVASRNWKSSNLWREIDEIDQDLGALLSKRMSILRQIEVDGSRISVKTRTNIDATRLIAEVVKQLLGAGESNHGDYDSGCAQTEALSIETRKWLLRSKTSPCGDSVTTERPA
jgi:hypothetical protein